MLQIGYRSTVAAPIVVAGVLWGAVAIGSEDPLPPESEARLGAFCELVSLAVASAQARADLRASRARIVKAGDEQRRRLERNLHDGAQQRLVSAALMLRVAQTRLDLEPGRRGRAARERGGESSTAGSRSCASSRAGSIRARSPTMASCARWRCSRTGCRSPVELDVPEERQPEHIEATAYYIASEALTNVVKHARGDARLRDGRVTTAGACSAWRSSTTARGGADPEAGTGILGLRDRAEAAGGTLFVISPPGRGTTVTVALPLTDD